MFLNFYRCVGNVVELNALLSYVVCAAIYLTSVVKFNRGVVKCAQCHVEVTRLLTHDGLTDWIDINH
ncbi:hypothetical protein MAR_019882 [Mya arenaria]|uniref:Uncharacterized protein n=1 Tax=Mya arenaria TaxID=6604 RepID=A0ABY7E395_MYAAR|nr:hypothetical protein MAR_019882 [Mya arenaria]